MSTDGWMNTWFRISGSALQIGYRMRCLHRKVLLGQSIVLSVVPKNWLMKKQINRFISRLTEMGIDHIVYRYFVSVVWLVEVEAKLSPLLWNTVPWDSVGRKLCSVFMTKLSEKRYSEENQDGSLKQGTGFLSWSWFVPSGLQGRSKLLVHLKCGNGLHSMIHTWMSCSQPAS